MGPNSKSRQRAYFKKSFLDYDVWKQFVFHSFASVLSFWLFGYLLLYIHIYLHIPKHRYRCVRIEGFLFLCVRCIVYLAQSCLTCWDFFMHYSSAHFDFLLLLLRRLFLFLLLFHWLSLKNRHGSSYGAKLMWLSFVTYLAFDENEFIIWMDVFFWGEILVGIVKWKWFLFLGGGLMGFS